MKKLISIFSILVCFTTNVQANEDKIHHFDWNGIPVTWLETDQLPLYDVEFYFADGSLGDSKKRTGETHTMFSLLHSGTRRFSQKDIADNLEFFGMSYGAQVYHTYSSYHFAGLLQDIIPATKQICHLFNDSVFQKEKLKNLWIVAVPFYKI